MHYDVIVIGGGPGGYTAANKAAANGLHTALFEKNKVGGTCLNRGCIPMKSLIESARILSNSRNGEMYGIHSENVSFDYEAVNRRRDEVVTTLRSGVERSLKANKVDVIYGQAKLKKDRSVLCEDNVYTADHIIIATGSIPAIPPIQGVELAIDSDRILETDYHVPHSMIIIGGGVIGTEIASALAAFDCQITILEMADHLLPTMDKDIGQRLTSYFRKRQITSVCSASVTSIRKTEDGLTVSYKDKNGTEQSVSGEEVLIATGRKANLEGLFEDDTDLEVFRGIVSDEEGRTKLPGIYVIGDARSGNIQLAHVAEAQGENIVDLILGKEATNDMNVIPSGVYTDPEIATVGCREMDLKQENIDYKVRKYLTGANGKCLIENSESGFVKVLTVDDVIVGGQIIAPHATELIGELAIAVEKKMTLKQFAEVVHPHPTISEMLWNVVKQ